MESEKRSSSRRHYEDEERREREPDEKRRHRHRSRSPRMRSREHREIGHKTHHRQEVSPGSHQSPNNGIPSHHDHHKRRKSDGDSDNQSRTHERRRDRKERRPQKETTESFQRKREEVEDQRERRGERGDRRETHGRDDSRQEPTERSRHRRGPPEGVDYSQYEYGGGRTRTAASEGGQEEGEEDKSEDANSATTGTNYALSGKLAAETNTYKGIVINYSEPEEARIPKTRWRLYAFKGDETLPTLYIHRQSAYLVGRDRRICDLPVDHPSCSKQHAVLQYRLVEYTKPNGDNGKRVRPYLIDLGSTNGSFINDQKIEQAKYYELKEKDVIKFGFSSREYVILHENSKGDSEDEEQEET